MGQTIGCAQKEVQTLQGAIETTSTSTNPGTQALQTKFSGALDDASNYYASELTKLNNSGIAGTQAIAKEVLNWRQGTFLPLSESINNYLLWAQNQDLFNTAQTRMDQTQRAVVFLESASPNPALQNRIQSGHGIL